MSVDLEELERALAGWRRECAQSGFSARAINYARFVMNALPALLAERRATRHGRATDARHEAFERAAKICDVVADDNAHVGASWARIARTCAEQIRTRIVGERVRTAPASGTCECGAERPCEHHDVTWEMREAYHLLIALKKDQRGRVLCWFCATCTRFVGPGEPGKCACKDGR